jgi:tyrosine-protein kinase Etk/Wzc
MNQPVSPLPQQAVFVEPESDEINLTELWYNLLEHKWLFVAITVAVLTLGGLYAWLATPIYQSDVLIQVEPKQGSALGALSDVASALDIEQSSVPGEIDILTSRSIVGEAVKKLHAAIKIEVDSYFPLFGEWYARNHDDEGELAAPFLGLGGYAWGGETLELTTFEVPAEYLGQEFTLTATGNDGWQLEDPNGNVVATGKVGEPVKFRDGRGEGEIDVSQLRARPGIAFTVERDSFPELYRDISKRLSASETSRESSMIRASFKDPDRVFAARFMNAVANAYLEQNVSRRSQEAQQSLEFLRTQLPDLKKQLEASEDALSRYSTKTRTVDISEEVKSLLQKSVDIGKQRLEAQMKLQELNQRFKPDHPSVRAARNQLAAISADFDKLNKQIASLPDTQQQYVRLARDVQVNTDLYTSLLNNAQQLEVAKAGTVGNVAIIDHAIPTDKPVKPRRLLVIVIAVVLGLILAFLVVQGLATLKAEIRDPQTLEHETGLPVYAIVPESRRQEQAARRARRARKGSHNALGLLAADAGDEPAVESLRGLHTSLQFAMLDASNHNILITGAIPSLGKSFISANLAYVIAAGGRRVLLIDADMRRSSLGKYFDFDRRGGLSEVLAGTVPFGDAVRREPYPHLDVLMSGATPPNPGELLMHPNFSALLQEQGEHYDFIVIDSPPVLPVSDALTVAHHCDTVFMVARAGSSTTRQVQDGIKRLHQSGARVTGLIFNGFVAKRAGYYRYRYYDKYYGKAT